MPALLSPTPRPLLPAIQLHHHQPSPARLASPPPIYCSKTEINISYARLRSPSLPPDPCIRGPLSMAKPSCSSAPRRRSKPSSHSLRRRRQISRVDYRSEHQPLHAFDKLPWIASLDMPLENPHPSDIADLSLLPDLMASPHIPPSGPGPVRRRKISPRTSPMVSSTDEPSDDHLLCCNLFPRHYDSRPSTPPPRFDSSHVTTFRHLMPVADDDASSSCIISPTEL